MRTTGALITGLSLLVAAAITGVTQSGSSAQAASASTWTSVIRINAGGSAFRDSKGLSWSADNYAVGGSVHTVSNDISGTPDPELFQDERWGMTGYEIPVANGNYQLKLYLAEINPDSGKRAMSVSTDDHQLLSDYVISDSVGDFAADVQAFDVTVTDGKLSLGFSANSNSASVAAIELLRSNATSVYRMNAGGPAFTDARGLVWTADSHATVGKGASNVTTHEIEGTDSPELYRDERWGMTSYDIPLTNATYVVRLYFAEINPASGAREFDVSASGKKVLDNFNISNKVGDYRADVEQFVAPVTDGELHLDFTASKNSASVSAIEVLLPLTQSTTDDFLTGSTTTAKPTTSTTSKPATTTTTIRPTTTTAAPVTTTTVKSAANVITPSMSGWKMVKSDDFNGTSLNTSNWGVYNGTGNEGVGFRRPSQLVVSNGELAILGQGDTAGGAAFSYSSTYGRYVIRAKMDVGSGYGPALLLWPDSEKWPDDGEIDISEMPEGARNQSHFTVHWGSNNSQTGHTTNGDFSQWHTFTLEWMSDHITLWIDGVQQSTITNSVSIPKKSMHLAVQNDVGASGHWIPGRTSSTPSTVSLHIDTVQVYQKG